MGRQTHKSVATVLIACSKKRGGHRGKAPENGRNANARAPGTKTAGLPRSPARPPACGLGLSGGYLGCLARRETRPDAPHLTIASRLFPAYAHANLVCAAAGHTDTSLRPAPHASLCPLAVPTHHTASHVSLAPSVGWLAWLWLCFPDLSSILSLSLFTDKQALTHTQSHASLCSLSLSLSP